MIRAPQQGRIAGIRRKDRHGRRVADTNGNLPGGRSKRNARNLHIQIRRSVHQPAHFLGGQGAFIDAKRVHFALERRIPVVDAKSEYTTLIGENIREIRSGIFLHTVHIEDKRSVLIGKGYVAPRSRRDLQAAVRRQPGIAAEPEQSMWGSVAVRQQAQPIVRSLRAEESGRERRQLIRIKPQADGVCAAVNQTVRQTDP
ncbi:hypothetical protein D3C75_389710 [compost metagenome]